MHRRVNDFCIAHQGDKTLLLKVRKLVRYYKQDAYEVAEIAIDTMSVDFQMKIYFLEDFKKLNAKTVDMETIRQEYDKLTSIPVQSLINKQFHPRADKMRLDSPIGLLASHYSHVLDTYVSPYKRVKTANC